MADEPSLATMHRILAQQNGQIAALLGLVTSLLQSIPAKQQREALERFDTNTEFLASVLLAEDGPRGDWALEGAEMVRATIAETVARK